MPSVSRGRGGQDKKEEAAHRRAVSPEGKGRQEKKAQPPMPSGEELSRLLSMGGQERAQAVLELQRRYGNRRVQRLLRGLAPAGGGPASPAPAQAVARASEAELQQYGVSPQVQARIEAERGKGQPLDAGVRAKMEAALGSDFTGVRIHAGSEAAALNREVGARAFTVGNDIFLGEGASTSDRELMAHELTHVVQQGGSRQGQGGPMRVTSPDDGVERQAEAVAEAVVSRAAEPEEEELQMARAAEEEEELQLARAAEEEEELQMARATEEEEGLQMARQTEEEEEVQVGTPVARLARQLPQPGAVGPVQEESGQGQLRRQGGPAEAISAGAAVAAIGYDVISDAIASSEGDVSWSMDKLEGIKSPRNDESFARARPFTDGPTITVHHEVTNLAGDTISLDYEITWQHNGHCVANVLPFVLQTNDAVGWSLHVDVEVIPTEVVFGSNGDVAAVEVFTVWRYSRVIGGDIYARQRLRLLGNGTWQQVSAEVRD